MRREAGGLWRCLERDPIPVLEDVLDRKVSISSARSEYGVVLTGRDPELDEEATERLRAEMAACRGQIVWTYDRGVDGVE